MSYLNLKNTDYGIFLRVLMPSISFPYPKIRISMLIDWPPLVVNLIFQKKLATKEPANTSRSLPDLLYLITIQIGKYLKVTRK